MRGGEVGRVGDGRTIGSAPDAIKGLLPSVGRPGYPLPRAGTAVCVVGAPYGRAGRPLPAASMAQQQPAIEDHGVIGDLHTVALVCNDGTLDFLCAPRFDSPPVFASLLDRSRGGRFELAPELDGARLRQLYLPDTNVLLTRFLSPDGVAEISDFMPVGEGDSVRCVVRRVKAVRGDLRFRLRCAPRFGYGPSAHRLSGEGGHALFQPHGEGPVV